MKMVFIQNHYPKKEITPTSTELKDPALALVAGKWK